MYVTVARLQASLSFTGMKEMCLIQSMLNLWRYIGLQSSKAIVTRSNGLLLVTLIGLVLISYLGFRGREMD